MPAKYTRSGGKFDGPNTVFTPTACTIADIANNCSAVSKIRLSSPRGPGSANGRCHIKISDNGSEVVLTIRDKEACQEIRLSTTNMQEVKLTVAQGARDAGFGISFQKK